MVRCCQLTLFEQLLEEQIVGHKAFDDDLLRKINISNTMLCFPLICSLSNFQKEFLFHRGGGSSIVKVPGDVPGILFRPFNLAKGTIFPIFV